MSWPDVWDFARDPVSVDEAPIERFLRVLEGHVGVEQGHVEGYRRLSADAKDPVIAMLIDLVVEDEERHHALLRRMAERLQGDIRWSGSPHAIGFEPPQPSYLGDLVRRTLAYARDERDEARLLRRLARDAGTLYAGVYALLLETMARDSEKHEAIMRAILDRIARSRAPER